MFMVENKNNIKSKLETSGGFTQLFLISRLWFYFSSPKYLVWFCIERWSYGKFPMPISRFGEVFVMIF